MDQQEKYNKRIAQRKKKANKSSWGYKNGGSCNYEKKLCDRMMKRMKIDRQSRLAAIE